MKKRIFTLMMAFLAIAGNAVWGQSTYDATLDISGNSATVTGSGISVSGNHIGISGDGNYLIKGDGNARDFYIDTHNEPTITLENVNLSHDGDPIIEINRVGEWGEIDVTLILRGENTFSGNDVGIYNTEQTNVEFAEGSTGTLTFRTGYGIANDAGRCGNIDMNGGTIILETDNHAIYSSAPIPVQHRIKMNSNVVVITNKAFNQMAFNANNDIENGIFFDNSTGDGRLGYMYGNVTLNSPLDLTDNDLSDKLDLRGGTLTIGDNNSLKRDNIEDVTGGTVVAFSANYLENSPSGCNATGLIPDYTLYGTNTQIDLQTTLPTCNNSRHQCLGWAKDNATTIEGATLKTAASYPAQTTNVINLNAAWVEIEKTITVEEGKNIPTENNYNKLIVHPSSLNVSYALTSSTSVTGVTFDNGALTGMPAQGTAGEHEYTVKVTCGSSTVEAKMILKVADTPQSIENATIELSNQDGFTYNGAEQYPFILKINDVVVPPTAYTCTWSESTGEKGFMNAGTYTLTAIKAVENSGYTGSVSNTRIDAVSPVKMNPRELSVSINDQTVEVGEAINSNIIAQEDAGETTILIDSKTIVSGEQASFTGNLSCAQSTNIPDEYPGVIEQGTMDLQDNKPFLKKNYTLNVTKNGTLRVITNIDDPGEIELVITGAETEDGKYIYNGVDYVDQEIVVKIKLSDGSLQTINPDEYNVAWKDENEEEVDGVKNVGVYKALITFNSDIYGIATVSKTIEITQRSLTVNLTEVPATIPNDVNLANLESWWSPWDEVSYVNVVEPEKPEFAYDAISLIDKNGNKIERLTDGAIVKVKLEGLALEDGEEGFLKMNYTPIWMYGGTEVDVEADGSVILPPTDGDDEDDNTGIEVVDPDDSGNSGSGIITKRYQLYLANKDYTFPDAKEDYAAEGLELFSRHNKKYTPAGSSFTVWYEHNGVANDGGYRIFIRRGRTGEYQEVKFDEVSKYYQIRNVQSDIYVRIYAADGFPVANEEITATDARAYSQAGKIIVVTPEPTDVQIVSMAGAVVASAQVAGQQEFANLTEGVYIVRMGETIVKLQVRN